MQNREPLISFTFDDFPVSALHTAGSILIEHGLVGTYYSSFGLMGTVAPTGQIFSADDIPILLDAGHELGCHHYHSYDTSPETFEASIVANRKALQDFGSNLNFVSMSYPISGPRPATKRRCQRHFAACRSGGQSINQGKSDLNALRSFFLEQSRDDLKVVERKIADTVKSNGWLIFATHDVAASPTRYGCTPDFFHRVVEASIRSRAKLVSVSKGLQETGLDLGS